MYIDQVIESFEEYLNMEYPHVDDLTPAEILLELAPSKYEKLLDKFIGDNFDTFKQDEETLFKRKHYHEL